MKMLKESVRATQRQTGLAVRGKGLQRKGIKVNVSTQLSCLLLPPLPISVVRLLPWISVVIPNHAYQQAGQ